MLITAAVLMEGGSRSGGAAGSSEAIAPDKVHVEPPEVRGPP
jgi:hypothetical protein